MSAVELVISFNSFASLNMSYCPPQPIHFSLADGFFVHAVKRYDNPVTFARSYTLAAQSRTTIFVDEIPGLEDTDVSASITAGLPIVVER